MPRRCSIAGVGLKPSRIESNRPRTRIARGGSYKAEPACAWGHHPFLRAADSLGLPSTGSSQPQSPDRGLAGQLLRHSVCRQPAPQPGREALTDARPSPADRARKHGHRRGDRLYGSLRLGKLRRRAPRGHAHAAGAILARSRAALPLVYEGVCRRQGAPASFACFLRGHIAFLAILTCPFKVAPLIKKGRRNVELARFGFWPLKSNFPMGRY